MPLLPGYGEKRESVPRMNGLQTYGGPGGFDSRRGYAGVAGKPTLNRSASDSRLSARSGRDSSRGFDRRDHLDRRALRASTGFREPRSSRGFDPRGSRGFEPLPSSRTDNPESSRRSASVPDISMCRRVGTDTIAQRGKGYMGNQDRFAHAQDDGKLLAGVFDGHGQHGDKVADLAKDGVAREVFQRARKFSPERSLRQAFEATQQQLEQQRHVANYSGTTAVAAFFPDPGSVIVANCGDSRAVLGRRTQSGKLQALDLSCDHTPCRPDERKRIEAMNGRVHQTMVPVMRTTTGGPQRTVIGMGPERVWDKGGTCGLGVSRALGDLHMHPFVIGSPEIVSKKLDQEDRMVVLGSDGVWNHLSSQEAIDLASRHNCPKKAARAITQVAHQRWITETGGRVSDDITAVVVRLDPEARKESRPSSEVSHRRY